MAKSAIEWTEATWNPIVGCSIVSPGCTNCYAMKMAARIEAMGNQPRYAGTTRKVNGNAVWTGKLAQAPESTLLEPLKRKKPTMYFVNSMSDLFHEDVPDEWIDRVFAVMALTPQHTFQVLTKRAKRMRDYMANCGRRVIKAAGGGNPSVTVSTTKAYRSTTKVGGEWPWPLPNIWLGVSTERQQEADERIPHLLQTPSAVRFISAEPLLGPIDLTSIKGAFRGGSPDRETVRERINALNGSDRREHLRTDGTWDHRRVDDPDGDPAWSGNCFPRLDWVIVGGESGHGARPMHPDWARSLREQCAAAGVNFFFKQWGNWRPEIDRDNDDPDWRQPYSDFHEPHFQILNLAGGRGFHGDRVHVMRFCSKKSAGRQLDGVLHDDMPQRSL